MSAADDLFDKEADELILKCLNLKAPKSFFLYAGAGSGKTRSLVEAVRDMCKRQGHHLSLTGQKIGVITYTNAACDEIGQRLEFDPRVHVSTIHAFAWALISGYDLDIRKWLSIRLLEDVAELETAQAKGRATSKAAADRARSIESKLRRRDSLDSITKFIYSPTGDNRTRDSLNHAEVIAITTDFLRTKPGLRRLLVTKYPALLIDESQDTTKRLMEAFLDVESENQEFFCLGLFGDIMQRIYGDGMERLSDSIPKTWEKPRKRMNHRCPVRVVDLINRIRKDDDGEEQVARSDAVPGFARLFIAAHTLPDKGSVEKRISRRMTEITEDQGWLEGTSSVKTLALEHSMSARRLGFENFFAPLYAVKHIRTSFLEGTGANLGFFTREVLPLVRALRASNRFLATSILRHSSPLLDRKTLEAAGDKQSEVLKAAKHACDGLLELIITEMQPTARRILCYIAATRIFKIPEQLLPFSAPDEAGVEEDNDGEEENEPEGEVNLKGELSAWREALEAPLEEIEKYDLYVRGLSDFDTHQGVKGLEFPRVMVVVSDEEAGGFLFAYDKLFGMKNKTKTDIENEAAGKETTIDRTRRLFYVTCSRAEKSLAVVYYTEDPEGARISAIDKGWFKPEEIEVIK